MIKEKLTLRLIQVITVSMLIPTGEFIVMTHEYTKKDNNLD